MTHVLTADVAILGGSFAGLSAALQLVRARRTVLVVDHGLPRNRFAGAAHGLLGHDGKTPQAILDEARAQLQTYPAFGQIEGEAIAGRHDGDNFTLDLADGRNVRARRLILASGVRDTLPLPGMQARWGHRVLHCPYCHGFEVADHPLGVLAVSPMSMHQALLLPDWGPTTYFSQGIYRPEGDELAQLERRHVTIEHRPVVELLGKAPELEAVRLADGSVVPIHALFVGSQTSLTHPVATQLGCAMDEGPSGPFVRVDDFKQTTVPGVFAAGDIATAMPNASLAMAAGTLAGVGAHRSLVIG